jgi:drug/metabolite transporter (DMT)-like permease
MSYLLQSRGRTPEPSVLAVLESLLVAGIWASSFVGVKYVLDYTGPFSAGGLRYFIAFIMSVPFLLKRWSNRNRPGLGLRSSELKKLSAMGIFQYTIGNAALFYALKTVSSTGGSLALSLVPIPVLIISSLFLHERARGLQLVGVVIAIGGSLLFFLPGFKQQDPMALIALGITVISFSVFPVLSRSFARDGRLDTITLTSIPLGIGGGALFVIALIVEGFPHMPLHGWAVILGLATVNTFLAYLLYNHSMRRLTAVQVNVMLNISPIGTALIAWGTLGERISPLQMVAMFMIIAGAFLVQKRPRVSVKSFAGVKSEH